MAWIAPFTATNSTTIASSDYNTYGRDNLTILRTNAWQLITSTTLSVATNTVTLSPVNTFKNLKVLINMYSETTGGVGPIQVTFNSDTGNNYDNIGPTYVDSSGLFSLGLQLDRGIAYIKYWEQNSNGGTAQLSTGELYILGYNDTDKQKLVSGSSTYNGNGIYNTYEVGGWWRNTAAITSIGLNGGVNNFGIGSAFYLYGG